MNSPLLFLLLDYDANANAQNQGINTALRALSLGEDDASIYKLEMLLQKGADANSAVEPGRSILHVAITQRFFNTVKVLLQGGACMRCRIGEHGNAVQTAGMVNDWGTMQILSNFGADVDPEDFSIGGPYSDPLTARSNRDSLTDEEVTRVLSAIKRPTVQSFVPVHRQAPHLRQTRDLRQARDLALKSSESQ